MTKPARKPDALGTLLDLQAQVSELVRAERGKRRRVARRRGKQILYSPPRELPGPKPSEVDIARAQRLWRRVR